MPSEAILSDAQRLVLGHLLAARRGAVAAVFALDARLAGIVRSTREPMLGQIRLTWWRDALVALDAGGRVPDEPVLAQVAAAGMPGAALAEMAEGWMILLGDDYADAGRLDEYAALRGGAMFAAAGRAIGVETGLERAGAGWALADLAAHVSDAGVATQVRARALETLHGAFDRRWGARERSIGLLAWLAYIDLGGEAPLVRLLSTIRFRLIGR